jgi:hypothetical protein
MSPNKKEEIDYEEYENLKNSRFKQQRLPGMRLLPSMFNAVSYFLSVGILFAGIGVAIFIFSEDVVSYHENYTNKTRVTFNITKKMAGDIMVYYKIDYYYQNNRRYLSSISYDQLSRKNISVDEIKKGCSPIIRNKDLNISLNLSGKNLDENDIAIPCGLMARSFILFNDTYNFSINGEPIYINDTNISRKYDRDHYHNVNLSKQWTNIEDEHFLVWMRPSPLSNFTKLYGRIEGYNFSAGSHIDVEISHGPYYKEDEFILSNISKTIYITTVNNFGGNNKRLALSYFIFGIICIILGIIFFFAFQVHNRKDK